MSEDGYIQCQTKGCEAWYPEAWGTCPICQIEENIANGEQQWEEKEKGD